MKENDFLKAPISAGGINTIKIDYRDGHRGGIGLVIFMAVFGAVALASVITSYISEPERFSVSSLIPLIFILIFFGIMVFAFNVARKKHQKYMQEVAEITTQGKKITGSIVSSETITVGSGDDSTTYHYFIVEFEDPETYEKRKIETPYLYRDMNIYNSDLPLQATVYVHGQKAYVDEIINPPLEKIGQRKHLRTLYVVSMIVVFFATFPMMIFFDMAGMIITFAIMVAMSLLYSVYEFKNRK